MVHTRAVYLFFAYFIISIYNTNSSQRLLFAHKIVDHMASYFYSFVRTNTIMSKLFFYFPKLNQYYLVGIRFEFKYYGKFRFVYNFYRESNDIKKEYKIYTADEHR